MDKSDLKKLNRAGLLRLLMEAEEENETLRKQIETLREQLEDRTIRIDKSGSIADAALELNGVFAAAQAACTQYTENMRILSEANEEKCRTLEQETKDKCREMEEQTTAKCEQMLAEAREQSDRYRRLRGEELAQRLNPDVQASALREQIQ